MACNEAVAILRAENADLRRKLELLLIKDTITDRLNNYGFTLDLGQYKEYEANFTANCKVVMSFGSHSGREGLGEWMAGALKTSDRGVHLTANFDIRLDNANDPTKAMEAEVRSKLHAACHFKDGPLSDCLTLGGIYQWRLRRDVTGSEPDLWLISFCSFEPYWSRGNGALLE